MQYTTHTTGVPVLTGPPAQTAAQRSWAALHPVLAQVAMGELPPASLAGLAVYYYCVYYVFGQPADGARAQHLAGRLATHGWPAAGQPWSAAQLEQAGALAWLQAQSASVGLPAPALPAQLQALDDLLYHYAQSLLAQPSPSWPGQLVRITRYLGLRHPHPTTGRYQAALLAAWPALPTSQFISLGLVDGLATELLCVIQAGRAGGLATLPAAEKLVRQGLRYLLATRRDTDFLAQQYAVFPDQFRDEPPASRFSEELSWSCGDAGQAWLLYEAQALLHDPELRKIAELVGLNTTLRSSLANTGITHASFYHGTAGMAQLYAQLFRSSDQPAYQVAYQYWLTRTQQLLWPDWPALGHPAPAPAEAGLFGGLTGIGLVLLSACHDDGLNWEAILV